MVKKGKFRSEPVEQEEEDDGFTLSGLDPEDVALIVRVFHFAHDHGMYLRDPMDRKQLVALPRRLLRVMQDDGIPIFPEAS